jgi:hypothetical protein
MSQMHTRSYRPPHRGIRLEQVGEALLKWCANLALKCLQGERRELSLDLCVIDQEEAPPLFDVRRANGRIEDTRLHLIGDRVRFEPPHRARRVQRFVEIHEALLLDGACFLSSIQNIWHRLL